MTTTAEAPKPVYTDEHPEYPFTVYNHETRQTKLAGDKKEKEALAKEGFVDDPLPPLDPDELTAEETAQLEALLKKASKALAKLGKLSGKHEDEKAEKHNGPPAKK